MENFQKVELLSPAGNKEGFYGAVHAGADAVYLAGSRFGARAYADNFTTEELLECIRYGHLFGRRLYLTVNTLLKDSELSDLYDYLLPLYKAGLDAVIVQDLGVFRFILRHFPGWKLHVSTQMTLCSGCGAALMKKMGASRIVPARELGLQELIAIKEYAQIELETFIHGAMCYCYSGQCLFSSILGGRSGNRGRCAQPCRLPYSVKAGNEQKGNCYPLSLKDMCTIENLPQLIEAGIDSFKIEGRMKKPEYTAGVTSIYRHYIDEYYRLREKMGVKKAAKAYHVEKKDMEALRTLYIRSEIQNGYYFRHGGREMVTMDSPAYSGSDDALLRKIREKYINTPLKMSIAVRAQFRAGQPAEVIMGYSAVQHSAVQYSAVQYSAVQQNMLRCNSIQQNAMRYNPMQHNVMQQNPAYRSTSEGQEISACVLGDTVEKAQKQPITKENVEKQLSRLGESVFYADKMEILIDENVFYPLKQINELRRSAAAGLEEQILLARGYGEFTQNPNDNQNMSAIKTCLNEAAVETMEATAKGISEGIVAETVKETVKETSVGAAEESPKKGWCFSIRLIHQLEAVVRWLDRNPADMPVRIYVEGDLLLEEWEAVRSLCLKLPSDCAVYAVLPYIVRASDREFMEQLFAKASEGGFIHGFLIRSMDGLGYLNEKKDSFSCRADAGLYIWNESAFREMSSYVEGFCLPYELKASEQQSLADKPGCEKVVYGRIPMMLTANCLYRTLGKCVKGSEKPAPAVLTDRYRVNFPVEINCRHCVNVIYNSVPLSLHQELSKWNRRMDLRMNFIFESASETEMLLDCFLKGASFPWKEYTTGHEKRGVE